MTFFAIVFYLAFCNSIFLWFIAEEFDIPAYFVYYIWIKLMSTTWLFVCLWFCIRTNLRKSFLNTIKRNQKTERFKKRFNKRFLEQHRAATVANCFVKVYPFLTRKECLRIFEIYTKILLQHYFHFLWLISF